jgi:hypothetical protein
LSFSLSLSYILFNQFLAPFSHQTALCFHAVKTIHLIVQAVAIKQKASTLLIFNTVTAFPKLQQGLHVQVEAKYFTAGLLVTDANFCMNLINPALKN